MPIQIKFSYSLGNPSKKKNVENSTLGLKWPKLAEIVENFPKKKKIKKKLKKTCV